MLALFRSDLADCLRVVPDKMEAQAVRSEGRGIGAEAFEPGSVNITLII